MIDYFEVLGLPRRAELDTEKLKERYHALSKSDHPDAPSGGSQFADVTSAYRELGSVNRRLRHLLDLEFSGLRERDRSHAMESELMDLFGEVSTAVGAGESVLAKKRLAKSAVAAALLTDDLFVARDQLEAIGMELHRRITVQSERLPEIDHLLSSDRDAAGEQLLQSWQAFSFLEKWQGQVREKLVELTF